MEIESKSQGPGLITSYGKNGNDNLKYINDVCIE